MFTIKAKDNSRAYNDDEKHTYVREKQTFIASTSHEMIFFLCNFALF